MKILSLYIKNIASIEEATIDFEHGPLAADPIFLITGDTGAGKTTILNAIALALYNEVPSLSALEGARDQEGTSTNSPLQIMRKGTGEAQVSLTFEGNDGVRYITEWHIHRARNKATGKLQGIIRTLRTASGSKAYGKNEVKDAIQELVGLTYEQFLRTTMLAQGQFANFIKESGKEKADILEKLTNTEIYTKIAKNIYRHYDEACKAHDTLQSEIKGAESGLLSDDDRQTLRERLAMLRPEIAKKDEEIKGLQAQITWLQQAENIMRQLSQLSATKAQAQATVDSDRHHTLRQLHSHYEATADIRRKIKEKTEAETRLSSLQQRMAQLSQAPWHEIMDRMHTLEAERATIESALAVIHGTLDHESQYVSIYEQATRVAELARIAVKTHDAALAHQTKSKNIRTEIDKSQAKLQVLKQKADDAARSVEAKAAEVSDKEEAMKGYDLNDLTQQYKALNDKAVLLENAIQAVGAMRQRNAEHAEALKSHKEAQEALIELIKRHEDAIKREPEATALHERLRIRLDGQKELQDHIASLRQKFSDSGECPVCGTKGAHLHTDEAISQKVAEAQAEEAKAARELQNIRSEIASCQKLISSQKKEISSREAMVNRSATLLRDAEAAAQKYTSDYRADDILERLSAQKSECIEKGKAAYAALKEAQARRNALDTAYKEMHALQNAHRQAEKDWDALHDHIAELITKAQMEQNNYENDSKTAQDYIQQIVQIIEDSRSSFFEAMLKDTAIEVVDMATAYAVSSYIGKKAKDFEHTKKQEAEITESFERISECLDRCHHATEGLTIRFGTDYQPRVVPLTQAGNLPTMTGLISFTNALESGIRTLSANINKLDGEIAAAKSNLTTLADEERKYFATSTLTRDEVTEISRIPEATILQYKKEIEAADNALKNAITALSVVEKQQADHAAQRPDITEGMTSALLAAQKQKVESERDTLTTECATNEERLRKDQEVRAALAGKHIKLKALKDEANEWGELNDMFGTKEGTKFRTIAQSYVLRALLGKANYYLKMLSARYRLTCDYTSLVIYVEDTHQGNAVRNVGSLSGGETFIVSLALALGLSSINREKINVDTLFIDEGFGSLDGDTLETVINTLDRLHQLGGRRIGIISHVEGLKSRIPTQLRVSRISKNASKIDLVTL